MNRIIIFILFISLFSNSCLTSQSELNSKELEAAEQSFDAYFLPINWKMESLGQMGYDMKKLQQHLPLGYKYDRSFLKVGDVNNDSNSDIAAIVIDLTTNEKKIMILEGGKEGYKNVVMSGSIKVPTGGVTLGSSKFIPSSYRQDKESLIVVTIWLDECEYSLTFQFDESKNDYFLKTSFVILPEEAENPNTHKRILNIYDDNVRITNELKKVPENSKKVEKIGSKGIRLQNQKIKLEDISDENIYELIGIK